MSLYMRLNCAHRSSKQSNWGTSTEGLSDKLQRHLQCKITNIGIDLIVTPFKEFLPTRFCPIVSGLTQRTSKLIYYSIKCILEILISWNQYRILSLNAFKINQHFSFLWNAKRLPAPKQHYTNTRRCKICKIELLALQEISSQSH